MVFHLDAELANPIAKQALRLMQNVSLLAGHVM